MTPEEKSKELVNRYLKIEWIETISLGDAGWDSIELSIPVAEAKECALIAVDEIINALKELWGGTKESAYYEKVKQEIEKL